MALFVRSPGTMHADRMPVSYPTGAELQENLTQYGVIGRITQPLPYSMYGSLRRSSTPWPFDLRSNPYGARKRQQQVLPAKPPRGFLPQGTNRNYGG